MKRISIHVTSKDRHSEVALLFQSLRTQTVQDFDILLLDDGSGTPITSNHFLMSIISRLKLENHKVKMLRNNISQGVCYARNMLIKADKFNNYYTCRLDDDCILEQDYLEKLIYTIKEGYDLATGVIPILYSPVIKRDVKHIGKIMNKHTLNKKGDIVDNKDECAYCYTSEAIIPTHQFRTNCLYKSKIHKKVKYPSNLTKVGFREEGYFSFQAILAGYKIAVNTAAVAYHLQTPSGGCRQVNYNECVQLDDGSFRKWTKKQYEKHGDFLK